MKTIHSFFAPRTLPWIRVLNPHLLFYMFFCLFVCFSFFGFLRGYLNIKGLMEVVFYCVWLPFALGADKTRVLLNHNCFQHKFKVLWVLVTCLTQEVLRSVLRKGDGLMINMKIMEMQVPELIRWSLFRLSQHSVMLLFFMCQPWCRLSMCSRYPKVRMESRPKRTKSITWNGEKKGRGNVEG